MSEFIKQFILESRDLVEQAGAALLTLERSPRDPECLDEAFRAIHTLKGGAAIVEFFAMERMLHAAEDGLSAARSGTYALTRAMVAECVACVDQVSRWLDVMEKSGELPVDAEVQVAGFMARAAAAGLTLSPRTGGSGAERIPTQDEIRETQARTTVRFTPHSASFLQGQDPLHLVASLPGLRTMELAPVHKWPALSEFDPFECMLDITALSTASAADVKAHFQGHEGECDIRALTENVNSSHSVLPESARILLQSQLLMLAAGRGSKLPGRIASAGRVASNVLRYCRRDVDVPFIASATEQSIGSNDPHNLLDAITKLLEPGTGAETPLDRTSGQPQRESVVRSLRVDAERVDALVRLTGELTVVKNAIGHVLKLAEADENAMAGALKGPHGDLHRLIGELQRAVLGVRIVPFRAVFQRFPRLVREISAELEKPVNLLIEGDETEADKAIVDTLFEPLLHIVRNAMDHGIEIRDIRRQRNKPVAGNLRIRASRQGGQVLVEVDDDGGGVDVVRVRSVAQERGIASSEMLNAMSDEQVVDLVFAAGFSTASRVTALSGRGVGMDIVRSAVERVGGRVAMESRPGLGATVRLMLPYSVMVTQVMTVEAGGQMFGIPLDAVVETVSVPAEQIVGVGAARAFVRRNRTLPVFDLAGLLQGQERHCDRREGDAIIVVALMAGQSGGFLVDRVGERLEIMLKPLAGLLAGVRGVAGTTILGDGRVLIVLDLSEVLR